MTRYFNQYKSQREYYESDILSEKFYQWYDEYKGESWFIGRSSCIAHIVSHKDCPWDLKDIFYKKDFIAVSKIHSLLYPCMITKKGWKKLDNKYIWSRIIPYLIENDKTSLLLEVINIYKDKLKFLKRKESLDEQTFIKIEEKIGLLMIHPNERIRDMARKYYDETIKERS